MKILIISGSHPRHLYIHQAIIESSAECAAIVMEREHLIPDVPDDIVGKDKDNFEHHFEERNRIEREAYGDLAVNDVFSKISVHECMPENLNSYETADFAKKFSADMAFIFGVDIIKDPLLSILPEDKVNLHLGLSPWYRGSATLFWPFYFLQPQFAGATFHKIVLEADAGDVLHQCVPNLEKGDGIHDVGAKTVVRAKKDLIKLLKIYKRDGWKYSKQTSTGRLFLTNDFEATHLRVVYDLFDNNIVDDYLLGNFGNKTPALIEGV